MAQRIDSYIFYFDKQSNIVDIPKLTFIDKEI